MLPTIQMLAAARSWSRVSNRSLTIVNWRRTLTPIGLPTCRQGRIVSGPLFIGGFEEGDLERDSSTEEVAAQIHVPGADPVQLRAQKIHEAAEIQIVVQPN